MNSRQVNHIEHHKTLPSMTLMRHAVRLQDEPSLQRIKAKNSLIYHEAASLAPARKPHINAARHLRAFKTERSQFVSHFVQPLGSTFIATPAHSQPIKAIIHKPKIDAPLAIDELLLRAADNIEDQLLNLEQQPIKRINRFTRSLVANRFNGIALD